MRRKSMAKLNQLQRQSDDSLSSLSNHIVLFYIDFDRIWEAYNIIRWREEESNKKKSHHWCCCCGSLYNTTTAQ